MRIENEAGRGTACDMGRGVLVTAVAGGSQPPSIAHAHTQVSALGRAWPFSIPHSQFSILYAGFSLLTSHFSLRQAKRRFGVLPCLVCLALAALVGSAGCDGDRPAGGTGAAEESGDGAAGGTGAAVESGDGAAAECRREPVGGGGQIRIAVIPKGTTHEFWKSIHAGALKSELELAGVQIIWKGPTKEDDRGQQISVVENFINAGVTGIVLAPLDDVALARPVQEAGRAGIGVVVMDSGLQADPCRDFASFVATDNYVGGQHGARRLGEILGGKGKVLLLRYQVGSASTVQREQGFLDVLQAEFPGVQVVSDDQYGGATTESAYAKAENLLNRFAELDGIFCPNESTTFGMLRALQGSGRAGKIKFVGFDSSDKLIQAMADGELHGLVLQDPLNMGYLAVKTLVAYLRGEPVATRIDTGSAVATPENMNEPRMRELLSPPIDKYLR